MPSLADNWIQVPLDIIQQIYDKHNGSNTWEKEVEEYFTSRLSNPSVWNSIVPLNEVPLKDVQHGQMVRFRGMVQDQLGPEMYGSSALVKDSSTGNQRMVTGKFKDELALGVNDEVVDWNATESRHCYYCVPIPGETVWVKQAFKESSNQHRMDLPNLPLMGGKKRPLEDGDNVDMAVSSEVNGDTKRPCPLTGSAPTGTRDINFEKVLNFPLPSSESIGCIIKMYAEEELPLNEVVEVVGIVSFNTPGMESDGDEREDFRPPSSVIPRIHCIVVRSWLHNNPHLSRHAGTKWDEELLSLADSAASIRNEVHGLFAEFFKGDALAADYLLCHLASRVYNRKDALAVGKLSLNLSNVTGPSGPQESTARSLYHLLDRLVTKAHYLPMSLQHMNTVRLIPKKDYQENRLISGCLQLSAHTHLILDETVLTEGQLQAQGLKNITALGNVTSWQKIEYDFSFHQVEFHTDIPVLILSERRSMLASDAHLPLKPVSEGSSATDLVNRLEANTELMNRIRMYLSAMRLLPFTISDALQEAVEKDFIQSRAPGQNSPMSTEDFHLLLVLSRLLSLTYGQKELSVSLWQRAKEMEMERKARLPVR